MRILIQRVSHASVSVGDEVIGKIGSGLVAFIGIRIGDTPQTAAWMAEKVAHLRIFEDDAGKMNVSVEKTGGSVLVVSQFTLYGELEKGARPNFMSAARPEEAEAMYEVFLAFLIALLGPNNVASGRFRARMRVDLTNEGPVTILLEREEKKL